MTRGALALGALVIGMVPAATAGAQSPGQPDSGVLPRSNLTLTSALRVDLGLNFARLRLHKGMVGRTPVWFVLTDVSDRGLAQKLGLNFAPRLANVTRGCSRCAQTVRSPRELGRRTVRLQGAPDFSPTRLLVPGRKVFPPAVSIPGASGRRGYSPFVRIRGTRIVFNAPIVAVGRRNFDVKTHKNTADRVLRINTRRRTVDLLFVRGFSAGQPILYLSFESSDPITATIERNTFVPALGESPSENRGLDPDTARAEIFTTVNGRSGTVESPPSQGQKHVIRDGLNAVEANLRNRSVLRALAKGGDAHNVFDVFPTQRDPRLAEAYSPLWDLQIAVFDDDAVARGENDAKTDSNVIRQLAAAGTLGAFAGGDPFTGELKLASSGAIINCPALGFTAEVPTEPQAPKPESQP